MSYDDDLEQLYGRREALYKLIEEVELKKASQKAEKLIEHFSGTRWHHSTGLTSLELAPSDKNKNLIKHIDSFLEWHGRDNIQINENLFLQIDGKRIDLVAVLCSRDTSKETYKKDPMLAVNKCLFTFAKRHKMSVTFFPLAQKIARMRGDAEMLCVELASTEKLYKSIKGN